MSLPNELISASLGGGAADTDFQISRSLRFNSADSAFLSRTVSTAGNRKTWTWSAWVKRTKLATQEIIFQANNGGSLTSFYFNAADTALFLVGGGTIVFQTARKFRDPSSWMHLVLAVDTTQSTPFDRIKFYVNGVKLTSDQYSTSPAPSINTEYEFNNACAHYLSGTTYGYANSYMADVHFIDGRALAPTDFGVFDSNNVWQPKSVSITSVNNGTDWASSSYNSVTGTSGSTDMTNAFDGSLSTYTSLGSGDGSATSTVTFTPPSSITVTKSVRVYIGVDRGQTISVNGSQTNASVSAGWNDTGFTGTLSSLAIGPTNAGSSSNIAAIEINGEILISSYNNSSGYGTNGFHLDFSDSSSNPALGLSSVNSGTQRNGIDFNNASYLVHAYDSDFNFGTGSFTIEAYVLLRNNNTIEGIYATSGGSGANAKFVFFIDNGTPKVHHNGFGSSTYLSATSTISTNTWTHLAFVRDGSSWAWYINGTQSGTGSDSTNFTFSNQGTEIGQGGESYFSPFDGIISNLRVANGTAVYSSNFTAPSTPLSSVANTVLLCCQSASSATAATVIPDSFSTSGTPIPGTFSDTGWTVSNLSAPPSNTGLYASNFVSSNGFNASYPALKAFDGSTSTYAQASTTGGTLTFTPPTAISYSSSIKIYMPSAGATATINGGSAISVANSSETTIATGSGTLTSLVLAASNLPGLAYIKIDDEILVNSGLDSGTDSLLDTPTNYGDDTGAGGEVRGNYATFNPLSIKANNGTMENGNLTLKASGSYYIEGKSTIDVFSVDNYSELTVTAASGASLAFGLGDIDAWVIGGGGSYVVYRENGAIISYPGNTTLGTVSSYTQGDVLGMAVDSTNVKFYKNGALQGTYAHGKSGTFYAIAMNVPNSGTTQLDVNFGQRAFAYTAPSGYKALCTQNLPEPTIADGSDYFDTKLYTGNGSTQTISGLSFSPDLTWVKGRSATQHHFYDTVRGAGEGKSLQSTTTNAEGSALDNATYGYLSAHTSDGFTVDAGSSPTYLNVNNINYVAWAWDAGANSSKTYAVTVVSDSGNKYRFDGHGTSAVTLDLEEGSTYTFDQSDSSNVGHPIRFSTTSDGTHGSGSEYTTGVETNGTPGSAGAYTKITIASGAPTLYYYCSVHSGMGGQVNTNSTAGATVLSGSLTSVVYNQSQTWSGQVSGTAYSSSYAKTLAFDNNLTSSTISIPASGTTHTFTPSPAFSSASTVTIYYYYPSAGSNDFALNGSDVTSQMTTTSGILSKTFNVANTGFNSLTWSRNAGISGIEVDGNLLVDPSVSVSAVVPSINSVVRANPAAGFSIVSVTEAAASGGSTVAHGLNAKPQMIIEKNRDGSTPWYIHNSELGDMSGSFLRFDTGTKQVDNSWNLVEPTSTTFGIDPTYVLGDANADVIYYCFAPVEGYSALGSYTANALDDGPFVYTGFRPKWIMIKHATGTGTGYSSWIILDTERDTYNVSDASLLANRTSAEGTRGDGSGTAGPWMDILSNGFKIRYSWQVVNGTSGDKYIYMAFAENPFRTSRAR